MHVLCTFKNKLFCGIIIICVGFLYGENGNNGAEKMLKESETMDKKIEQHTLFIYHNKQKL